MTWVVFILAIEFGLLNQTDYIEYPATDFTVVARMPNDWGSTMQLEGGAEFINGIIGVRGMMKTYHYNVFDGIGNMQLYKGDFLIGAYVRPFPWLELGWNHLCSHIIETATTKASRMAISRGDYDEIYLRIEIKAVP